MWTWRGDCSQEFVKVKSLESPCVQILGQGKELVYFAHKKNKNPPKVHSKALLSVYLRFKFNCTRNAPYIHLKVSAP